MAVSSLDDAQEAKGGDKAKKTAPVYFHHRPPEQYLPAMHHTTTSVDTAKINPRMREVISISSPNICIPARIIVHMKLVNPSTGGSPGFQRKPNPSAKCQAYRKEMYASSVMVLRCQARSRNNIVNKIRSRYFIFFENRIRDSVNLLFTVPAGFARLRRV